ncbi:ricin-type beta-trefoil lectin domain protein [Yoonia sp. SS1-5]|uniref:Ricin-type beta-trefoil lectin domain protein n=1 Tax=Yoonia rhodophyticola TaxID=3137370 RepID=A0AAN0MA68_9RHOB
MGHTSLCKALCAGIAILLAPAAQAQTAVSDPSYLQLVDRLDRPQDGYCLDVVGSGGRYAFDRPLVVHNCKPGQAADEIVTHMSDGSIRFPAFDLCLTAMGGGRTVLPGISLALRDCGENTGISLLEVQQQFQFQADGKLNLKGSDLCLVVGPRSAETASSAHRWRPIYMDVCDTAPTDRATWALIPPMT